MPPFASRSARTRVLLGAMVCLSAALSFDLLGFAQQPKHPLTNDDITKMVKGGFTDEVVVALIEANDTDFDVSIGGLTALKEAGISGKIMEAMLKAEARKRQGASEAAPSPPPPARPAQPLPSPPPPMMPNPAMAAGGGLNIQQMMSAVMGSMGGGGGTLDMSQLPPVSLILDGARRDMAPSIAQVANTQTKGDGMPGAGSGALSMLTGLGSQALRFASIGGMFAAPVVGMAMGMAGGLGHHGPPKVTYVWALPGRQSAIVLPSNRPRFEMLYGNLLGIDPDAYEPFIVKLVNSKDNWRLVGATKTPMGQIGAEAYEKVTEVRVPVKSQRLGRGEVQFEPSQPLEPGEYGLVLRAIHPGKRSAGSLGGPAEQSVFFSVWDFSIGAGVPSSK